MTDKGGKKSISVKAAGMDCALDVRVSNDSFTHDYSRHQWYG